VISFHDGEFRLESRTTAYWFRVTRFGHLEHVHYGRRFAEGEPMVKFKIDEKRYADILAQLKARRGYRRRGMNRIKPWDYCLPASIS
jgi:hypothetical protein